MRIRWNTETFIKMVQEIHSNKYEYSKTIYKSLHDKIVITCPVHGDFIQLANHHKRGRGCSKCNFEKQATQQRSTTQSFIDKANIVHQNVYNYSKTVYGQNAQQKVIVTCIIHGDFTITPNNHLRKQGCAICGKLSGSKKLKENYPLSWTKTNWIKRCEGKLAKFYIVRIFNQNENFYKIGITSKSIERRFTNLPYKWEVVELIESEDANYIFDLEKKVLRLTKTLKYIPEKYFAGQTECRTIFNLKTILMENQTMQNVINGLDLSEEQYLEAYNYLYDEYGFTVSIWSPERLRQEVINYWDDRGITITDL